jgi:hypothetical protein
MFQTLLSGQIRSGSIVGKITDPTNAPVPHAEITIIAEETNVHLQTITNAVGEYTIPYLAPGVYTVKAVASGFSDGLINNIAVGTADTVRADIKLSVGTVTSAVEVVANAVTLQTESAAVQNVSDEKVIQTVPNVTRNPFYFTTLQPGVVPRAAVSDSQGVRSFGIGTDARRQYSAISANGGVAFNNDLLLDGISIQSPMWNEATVLPNSEGIQEVRTLVNNFSAEYGRGQGIITIVSKSGTNQYHGSVFYRLRHEALNANSFGNNARGIAKPPFRVNTYGGTAGGPIRKNTAFFFVSYEGLNNSLGLNYFRTVPTARERAGDFSQTLVNVNGKALPLKLFDPFNVTQLQPNVYQRTAIPNSIIPTPNPFALRMLSYYPMPNRTPDDAFNTNNYFLGVKQQFNRNSINSRVDYDWRKHSFYGTGGLFQGSVDTPSSWGPASLPFHSGPESFAGGYGLSLTDRNPYAAIGDTVVLSPRFVLDIRYGITRTVSLNVMPSQPNFDYSQFGIPAEIQAINPVPGHPPNDYFGGTTSNWSLLQGETPNAKQSNTNHHLVASATKVIGSWNLKFGGEYRVYLDNFFYGKGSIYYGGSMPNAGHGSGSDAFTRQMINATGVGIGAVSADLGGYGPASLLLGAGTLAVSPGSGLAQSAFAHKYGALYTQNDWRATAKLTINLGLRWDVQPGVTDRFNDFCAFDPGGKTFGTAGAFVCPGANGNTRNLWHTSYHDFGPRVGVAYRISNSFVVRAGYGITYLPTNTGYRNSAFDWGMDQFAPYTDSEPYGSNPSGVPIGLFNSPSVNHILPATGADTSLPQIYGSLATQRFFVNDYPSQNAQQWNLFVEKALANAWQFSAGYSASKGSHLTVERLPLVNNQFIPQSTLDSWRQQYIASNGKTDPGQALVPNPLQPANGALIPYNGATGAASVTAIQALLPFPLFTGVNRQAPVGFSSYHSLVLSVTRRLSQGLMLNAHYTWSKSLDFSQTENFAGTDFSETGGSKAGDLLNYRNNYSPSYFDIPQRFVLTVSYEMPFGDGKQFNVNNRFTKAIIRDWKIGAVALFQAGAPIQISGASNGSLNGRPDRVPGIPVEVPKELQHWYDGKTTVTLPDGRQYTPCNFCFLKYNPDAFRGRVDVTSNGSVVNDVYWVGNAAPTYEDIRGTGLNNWNFTLERTIRVNERMSLDFSGRITNLFNHTQLLPNVTGALGTTNVASSPAVPLGVGLSGNFGTISANAYDPRQIELFLKLRL